MIIPLTPLMRGRKSQVGFEAEEDSSPKSPLQDKDMATPGESSNNS
jgi:hypothetical protein